MRPKLFSRYRLIGLSALILAIAVLLFFLSCTKEARPTSPVDVSDVGQLLTKSSISGTVHDKNGLPLAGVAVITDTLGYAGFTDSSGNYFIPRVRTGVYDLQFVRYKYLDTVYRNIEVGVDQQVEVDPVALSYFACKITGKVMAGGVAKRGAGVGVANQSVTAFTNLNGDFTLTDVDPSGRTVIAVLGETGFGEIDTIMQPGDSLYIVINLDMAGGSVSGTLYDASGNTVANTVVQAFDTSLQVFTDSLGVFVLDNIPSGQPVEVLSGLYSGIAGLTVSEGSQLTGLELKPLPVVSQDGVIIGYRYYVVPLSSGAIKSAAGQGSRKSMAASDFPVEARIFSGADKISCFIWDLNNDNVWDTLSNSPMMVIPQGPDSQVVGYGVVTLSGDTVAKAFITIKRVSDRPVVVLANQPISIAPRDLAMLAGKAICLSGGIRSYAWDFDGDGVFDWTRPDIGTVIHRYFTSGTYTAIFKVVSASGVVVLDTIQVLVLGAPVTLPQGTLLPPEIIAPLANDTVPAIFTLRWNSSSAGASYNVLINSFSPPESVFTMVVSDTECAIAGLQGGMRYFVQIEAILDDSVSKSLSRSIVIGDKPLFMAGSYVPTDTVTDDSVTLSWQAVNPMAGAMTYAVYFGTDMPPSLVDFNVQNASLKVKPTGGWIDGIEYYWQVEARNSADTAMSPVLQFVHQTSLSNDAFLVGLTISTGTLSPAFDSSVSAYSDTVSNSVANITVTPQAHHIEATITVNGTAVLSGNAAPAIALPVGDTTITVQVTAANGITQATYTIIVHRKSLDVALDSLIPSAGVFVPVFNVGVMTYADTVPWETDSIKLIPYVRHAGASLTVNGIPVISGNTSPNIGLVQGDNSIIVAVVAEDTAGHAIYTVTVTRNKSTDAGLANLLVSAGTLGPVFDTATLAYVDTVPNNVDSINVTPLVRQDSALMTVNSVPIVSGSPSANLPLLVGNNTITISVTSWDAAVNRSYIITVYRRLSTDAALLNLAISAGALSPAFDSTVLQYTDTLQNVDSTCSVTPFTNYTAATVTVNGIGVVSDNPSQAISLPVGNSVIMVRVLAEDTTIQRNYVIDIHRKSRDDFLSDLNITAGTLAPVFTTDLFAYVDTVDDTVTSVRLTPTAQQANATIFVNSVPVLSGNASAVLPIITGDNLYTIEVFAEDTTDGGVPDTAVHKTYTVSVTRLPSSNARLAGLTLSDGTLSPVFDSDTVLYNVTVASGVDSISVTATVEHDSARLMINDVAAVSGAATQNYPLVYGSNTACVLIEVMAEYSEMTCFYQISVYRQPVQPVLSSLADTVIEPGGFFNMLYLDGIYTDPDVTDVHQITWVCSLWSGFGATQGITAFLDTGVSFPAIAFNAPVGAGPWYGRDTVRIIAQDAFGLSDTATMVYAMAGSRQINTGSAYSFNSLAFPSYDIGYAGGGMGEIWKTSDHGLSWSIQSSGEVMDIQSVFFLDSLRGWFVTTAGHCRRTVDGGLNWLPADSAIPTQEALNDVHFCDSLHGYAVGEYIGLNKMIFRTSDGTHWQVADDSNRIMMTMNGVWAFSPDTAIMVGNAAMIWRTVNGGVDWTFINSGATGENLMSVFFIGDTGWIVGQAGYYSKSVDRGLTWVRSSFTGFGLTSVHFSDTQNGWCSGWNGNTAILYRTSDGGASWTGVPSFSNQVRSVVGFGAYDVIGSYTGGVQRYMVQLNPTYP